MGKGFIYKIDSQHNRTSNNIENVYSTIYTGCVKFEGKSIKQAQFVAGDLFCYQDDDLEELSGIFICDFCFGNEMSAQREK